MSSIRQSIYARFTALVFSAAFVLCACSSLFTAQASAAEITLRFANFPPASTFPCVGAEHWIEEVQKLTNGKVKVDHYPAGTLVDIRSMIRGIIKGQADIGCFSVAYFPGMFPLTSAFELPMGFRSARDAGVALMKALNEFSPAEFEKFKIVTAFACPPSQVMSRLPVKGLESMKGLRLRAAGIMADEVSMLGGSPVSMPQSEAPDAISRGAVDGVFSSLDVYKDLNYAEPCRNVLITDMSVYPFMFVMNRKTWESLPEDVKKVIDSLALPTAEWIGTYVDNHAKESLEWAKQTYGVKVEVLSDEERAKALETVSPLVKKWEEAAAAKNLPAAKMLDFIRSEVKAAEQAK